MQFTRPRMLPMGIAVMCVIAVCQIGRAEISGLGKQVSIHFQPFSLNAGDKIYGIKVTTTSGNLTFNYMIPEGWQCDQYRATIRCYCTHPGAAITNTGLLPEILVVGASSSISLKAWVELLDSRGQLLLREVHESGLIVK